MTTFPKQAILPCEIKSREFESKLLLACCLAEDGWSSVVGSRNDIHMKLAQFPRSIYLGKDVRFSSKKILTLLKLLGHPFVAMDEEALIYLSREKYRKARVDGRMLKSANALFAWGPDNAKAWTESEDYGGAPIFETGNGRIDLLRAELRGIHRAKQQDLEARHGPFVLVNTNFGSINHFINNLSVKPGQKLTIPAPPEGYFAHRIHVYEAFLELLPKLATRFPRLNFILRPHPSENHEIWRKTLEPFKNCKVISEGGVLPWVLASKAVIHNGCTTGIEAYLLDKTPIAFMPLRSDEFDIHLPNDLSLQRKNIDEISDTLEALEAGKNIPVLRNLERESLLKNHVSAASGRLASELLVEALNAVRKNTTPRMIHSLTWPLGALATQLRAGIKHFHRNRPGHKSNVSYTRHRFPVTPLGEVHSTISSFATCLDRFKNIGVREIESGLIFEIYQK
jgi:surface carbohydrate biosynthesis protein